VEGHDALERFEQSEQMAEAREHFGRRVAVLVAVMAAMLAVATLSASQSTENTILDQAKATDAYNELEANSLKKHINGNDAALLRTLGAGNPAPRVAPLRWTPPRRASTPPTRSSCSSRRAGLRSGAIAPRSITAAFSSPRAPFSSPSSSPPSRSSPALSPWRC